MQRIEHRVDVGPRFIHEPCYVVPESYKGLQNTDPFVSGEEFLYGFCKQPTFGQLAKLKPGSIILFGSCKGGGFVLDTLFVVGNRPHVDHSSAKDLKGQEGHIPQEYMEVTVRPWYESVGKANGCARPQKCRLYFGATPDNPAHNGTYSFFPCQPYEAGSRGFARPKIDLIIDCEHVINPRKRICVKFTALRLDAMKSLWDRVVEQVKGRHLELGVYAQMPEKC